MLEIDDIFGKTKTTRDLEGCIFANSVATPQFCKKACPAPSLCRESKERREEFFCSNGNGGNCANELDD